MPPDQLATHHFEAMGTTCALFAVGVDRGKVFTAEAWIRSTAARLTRFAAASEVSRLNAAMGRWQDVSPELEELLRESLRAFELSRGLVNVAVLPSMLAIGYTCPLSDGPTAANLGDALPLPSLPNVLTVRNGRARLAPGCGIDLGGVAKGWIADRVLELMGANALANLGGDLSASGAGPDGLGWPVGIGDRAVRLRDQGAATSSVLRRRWGEVHHLIDPRTGLPSRSGLHEVSVVAGSGLEAEVIAKTALLAGPDLAPAICAAHALAWWLGPANVAAAGRA
jgi:thiamine biosynthesis lipoprotein